MTFLRDDIPKAVRTNNREKTLEYYGGLTDLNKPDIQEAVILAYSQRARYVCGQLIQQFR